MGHKKLSLSGHYNLRLNVHIKFWWFKIILARLNCLDFNRQFKFWEWLLRIMGNFLKS